ncbi:hypothetical protein BGZ70_010687, partial [Mortierella alpina]
LNAVAKEKSLAYDDGIGLELFTNKTSDELGFMLKHALDAIPHEKKGYETGTTAERRRRDLVRRTNLIDAIYTYFKNYWDSLVLIAEGKFTEGIFKQLKNSGSWCEVGHFIVNYVKAAPLISLLEERWMESANALTR